MIIPYHVDVPMERMPVANWVIIGLTCLAYLLFLASGAEVDEELASQPWVTWAVTSSCTWT